MHLYSASWKGPAIIVCFGLLSSSLLAQTNAPARKYSSIERMKTAHLKAAHEDAERLQQARRSLPPLPGLHDYKAILHAHAEDSEHTGGTRPEMLADAKKAGVQVIMLTDHLRPPAGFYQDSWRGMHDGVLFIPGSEALGFPGLSGEFDHGPHQGAGAAAYCLRYREQRVDLPLPPGGAHESSDGWPDRAGDL